MYIINLDSVDRGTLGVGLKASGLGFLKKSGFSIPTGFVITTEAFEKFLNDTEIGGNAARLIAGISPEDPKTAAYVSGQVGEMFAKVSGIDFLIKELREAYNELSFGKEISVAGRAALDFVRAGRGENFISVRPSILCEKEFGFAGHGKAFLNLIGQKQLLAAVKDCWMSVFSPEAILYRKVHGIEKFSLAVIVQKMVDSELSGVMFTSEPVSGDKSKTLIEGCWGLGETLSSGAVSPDQYLIEKETGLFTSKKVNKKLWLRRRGPLSGTTIQEKVPMSRVSADTLFGMDLLKFSQLAEKIEGIMGGPQEIEWSIERGRLVILQSRPAVFSKTNGVENVLSEGAEKIASGIGVSGGIGKGKAIVSNLSDLQRPQESSVLVTKNLSVEILPFMRWFSGIVTEQGGCGSGMASVGRELGIPIITGVENATIIFSGRQEIVVDGMRGEVYSENL